MPERIQRQRKKGWRMPEGAIYVGRPSPWGNPYRHTEYLQSFDASEVRRLAVLDFRHGAIERRFMAELPVYPTVAEIRAELRGHDLVCWCPLDEPCHADVLLELANA